MNAFKHIPNIHQYLEQSGVLTIGTDEQIKAVKKKYRKEYLLLYKRWQRANKPEFSIHFSREKGEFAKIRRAAREHRLTIPGFLKQASLAYIDKTFIVPDRAAVARIEQLLSQCLNELQALAKARKVLYWQQVEDMQRTIEKLEKGITEAMRYPKPLYDS